MLPSVEFQSVTEPVGDFPSSDTYQGTVDEDAVAAFALATNDRNLGYLDGVGVPPLFTATLILRCEWESQSRGAERYNVLGARGSVHGQHDVHFHGPVRPRTALSWSGATFSAHQTRGGVLVVQRIMITDQAGSALVEHFWSSFHIAGKIDKELGAKPADHSFPEESRQRLIGTKAVTVDRDQAFRYAGVSGDHAGHAISDDIAQFEGYPSKILQGMCTFALASGALVELVADGDPYRLGRLAVRFARPAFPRSDLEVNVYDAGRTADGRRAFAFEAVQDDVAVLRHGRVELVSEH